MSGELFQAEVACAHCRDSEPAPVKLLVVRQTALLPTMPATVQVAVVTHHSKKGATPVNMLTEQWNRRPGRGRWKSRDTLTEIPTPKPGTSITVMCRCCKRPRRFDLGRVLEAAARRAEGDFSLVTVYI